VCSTALIVESRVPCNLAMYYVVNLEISGTCTLPFIDWIHVH
jgi:hypothetical protein